MAPSGFLMKSCEWPRIKGIEKDMAWLLANETEKGAGAVKIKYIYWKQEWWTSKSKDIHKPISACFWYNSLIIPVQVLFSVIEPYWPSGGFLTVYVKFNKLWKIWNILRCFHYK